MHLPGFLSLEKEEGNGAAGCECSASVLNILDLTQPFGIKVLKANILLDQNKTHVFVINYQI